MNDGNPPTPQLYDKLGRLRERVAELERIEEARRASYATRAALDTAEMIERRNRELALLNEMTQAFTATLDPDQVVLSVLDETRRLLNVTGTSIWLLEGGRFFFAARALDLPVDPMTSLFIALASALLTVLPLTPSGLGLVESGIVVVLLLASDMGLIPVIARSQAVSVALLDRIVAYWSLMVVGRRTRSGNQVNA